MRRQIISFDGDVPLRGSDQGAIRILKDGAIASCKGRIRGTSGHRAIVNEPSRHCRRPDSSTRVMSRSSRASSTRTPMRIRRRSPGRTAAPACRRDLRGDRRGRRRDRLDGRAPLAPRREADLVGPDTRRGSTRCWRAARRPARSRAATGSSLEAELKMLRAIASARARTSTRYRRRRSWARTKCRSSSGPTRQVHRLSDQRR